MARLPDSAGIYKKLSEQGKSAEGFLEAPLAYDAVWAIALGECRMTKKNT